MDEIKFLQNLAAEAATVPAEPLADLRLAVRNAIAVRQAAFARRQSLIRLATLTGVCGMAATALFAISVYAFSDMARGLAWNSSVMHLISF